MTRCLPRGARGPAREPVLGADPARFQEPSRARSQAAGSMA